MADFGSFPTAKAIGDRYHEAVSAKDNFPTKPNQWHGPVSSSFSSPPPSHLVCFPIGSLQTSPGEVSSKQQKQASDVPCISFPFLVRFRGR